MEKAKWEYRWLDLKIENVSDSMANQIGRDGWELVAVDNGIAFFKRPLEIEHTDSAYVDTAQLEKLVTRIIGREFGLDQK